MTFKELNQKLGGNEKQSDWRQAKAVRVLKITHTEEIC